MYGCESWTVKKAECWRIDAFELWCWRRLLRVPWTARRSNQSILKEGSVLWKDWCWSWNSNTLATSCEELTHWKRLWCWEGLGTGGEEDDRGRDGWMASPTQWTWVWVDSQSWWWTRRPGVLRFMGSQRVRHDWATELNWCTLKVYLILHSFMATEVTWATVTTDPAKWGHSFDMYKLSLTWFCAKQKLSTCIHVCECVYTHMYGFKGNVCLCAPR